MASTREASVGGDPATADRSPICVAPFVAMEFDPFGDVLACCANTLFPLGNVTRSSLREIWDGPRAQALRAAVTAGDLSLGCSVCRHRLAHGHGELARDYYDSFPVSFDETEWPYSLQFSLHNTCNLECVMCGADRSSRIRTRRSHLAPLPHAYDEGFFRQLEPFLEHCGAVDFSGGEPFLVREHHQVWDMVIAMERRPLCSLTTNGTVWNERVEHVLGALDTHISVSVDGMTPETFEAIRVGADFHGVMANVDRFLAYTRERGTVLTLSWSLVRRNWFELGAAMRFAEERGVVLKVQTVIEPEFGLQRLPTDELRVVVDALEAEGRTLVPDLQLNRSMWEREVGRLRTELEQRQLPGVRPLCMEPASPDNAEHITRLVLQELRPAAPSEERAAAIEVRGRADLARWTSAAEVGVVDLDRDGNVTAAALGGSVPLQHPAREWTGSSLTDVLRAMETGDRHLWIGEEAVEPDRVVHMLWVGEAVRDKIGLVTRMVTFRTPRGLRVLVACDASLASLRRELMSTPVQVGAPRRNGSVVAGR